MDESNAGYQMIHEEGMLSHYLVNDDNSNSSHGNMNTINNNLINSSVATQRQNANSSLPMQQQLPPLPQLDNTNTTTTTSSSKKRKTREGIDGGSSSTASLAAANTKRTRTRASSGIVPHTAKEEPTTSAAQQEEGGDMESGTAAPGKKGKSNGCRYDNSLSLLTRKFVGLITEDGKGMVDLNRAAQLLNVQKRRIYDITNVLEGIGLIEKKSKNNVQWKGSGLSLASSENLKEFNDLKEELRLLEDEDNNLAQQINEAQENLKRVSEDSENQKKSFVTHSDICNIGSFREETIIAIRAPSGTSLIVPDPDEGMIFPKRRFQIFLKSPDPNNPIKVYLLSSIEELQQQQQLLQQQQQLQQSFIDNKPEYEEFNSQSILSDENDPPGNSNSSNNPNPGNAGVEGVNVSIDDNSNSSGITAGIPHHLVPNGLSDYMFGMEESEGISDLYDDIGTYNFNSDLTNNHCLLDI